MSRLSDLRQFYELMSLLEERNGGLLRLSSCSGRLRWPRRGVYFFFEQTETRAHTGSGLRVVRIGTHALKADSGTTLWKRLSQHAGQQKSGGGNHRGSIFRLLVGQAMMNAEGVVIPKSWGIKAHHLAAAEHFGVTAKNVRDDEVGREQEVSRYIKAMPFLFVDVGDEPGEESLRGVIERNSISLLSNHKKEPLDPQSSKWLGRHSGRERVRSSGLWNNNHVEETYSPEYLGVLKQAVLSSNPLQ
jgi:hypothetical protein